MAVLMAVLPIDGFQKEKELLDFTGSNLKCKNHSICK